MNSQFLLSEAFVESTGAILFQLSTKKICILHHIKNNEFLLGKGRRNCDESRHQAALRELFEETGFKSRLLPVTMQTRAPPAVEVGKTRDVARTQTNSIEAVGLQMRTMKSGALKLVWWYIAAIEEDVEQEAGEEEFEVLLCDFDEALMKLTFESDREIASRAIDLVVKTYG